jgi:hypothetical protein
MSFAIGMPSTASDASHQAFDLWEHEGRNALDGPTPSIAIDLPVKILIAEDPDGKVWVSYNDRAYIQARHHLPEELFRSYGAAGVDRLAANAAE